MTQTYNYFETDGQPIKAWTRGVPVEETAQAQLENVARLPFIHSHVAAMPDVHWGMGATIGSVIPCKGGIIPAAVGVDIGCGMMAVHTSISANQLPDNLLALRNDLETAIPHGRSGAGRRDLDKGAWEDAPSDVVSAWGADNHRGKSLDDGLK